MKALQGAGWSFGIRPPQRHASATTLPVPRTTPGSDAGPAIEVVGVVRLRQLAPGLRFRWWLGIVGYQFIALCYSYSCYSCYG